MKNETIIDGEVLVMYSPEGFSNLYWKKLIEARKGEQKKTNEEVFNDLNQKFYNAVGQKRYSNYDSFMVVEKRNKNKNPTMLP